MSDCCDRCIENSNKGCKACVELSLKYWYVTFALIVLGTIILGSILADMWNRKNEHTAYDTDCPVYETPSHVRITKQLWSQWNWKYQSSTTPQFKFVQKCPSHEHDVKFYVGDHLASISDKKIISWYNLIHLNDCHMKRIYNIEVADSVQKLINMNGIWTSVVVKDPSDKIVAYVDSANFYDQNIKVYDSNSTMIAQMQKNFLSVPWYWDINVYNLNSSVADMRLLATLAGQLSFSSGNSTDICNYFFVAASITTIVFVVIEGCIGCLILYLIGDSISEWWNSTNKCESYNEKVGSCCYSIKSGCSSCWQKFKDNINACLQSIKERNCTNCYSTMA
jgi:hypothetical protein